MENTTNESESRNAAKVAGGVAAVALFAAATVKGVRYGIARFKGRAAKHIASEQ